jgi:ferric-dicitrate binding protein FerR (iron transport regulator)
MDKKDFDGKDFFSKVLSGNATKQEEDSFEQWLSMSDKNRSEFESYKRLWESLHYLKRRDLNSAKLKTRVKILEKQKRQRNFYYYWQKVAAVLLVPVLIASAYFYFDREKATESHTATVETVKTPYGARTSLPLPDGSVVWLNAGSEISYPHKFRGVREVELSGEMYLEVKKGNIPFIVKTKYGNVEVLGTKFNVSAYDNEPFQTALLEGSVAIKAEDSNKKLQLEPGFLAILQNGKFEVSSADVSSCVSWKDGKLEFRREPFELVAKKLERWFNVTIELKGEGIKNLWYTGTIEMESFSEVLELIKNTTPIEYSFNSKTRVLSIESKIFKEEMPM